MKVKAQVEKLNRELTAEEAKNVIWRSVGRKGEKRPQKQKPTEEEVRQRETIMAQQSEETPTIQEPEQMEVSVITDDQRETRTRGKKRKGNPNPYQ